MNSAQSSTPQDHSIFLACLLLKLMISALLYMLMTNCKPSPPSPFLTTVTKNVNHHWTLLSANLFSLSLLISDGLVSLHPLSAPSLPAIFSKSQQNLLFPIWFLKLMSWNVFKPWVPQYFTEDRLLPAHTRLLSLCSLMQVPKMEMDNSVLSPPYSPEI